MRLALNWTLFLWLSMLPWLGMALPNHEEQIIHIVADSSTFNYKTRFNIYQGNVRVDQGVSHITAERLTTQSNSKHQLEEAIAYGNNTLAEYWTIPRSNDKPLHAKAKTIKLYPLKSLIILEGDVIVSQGESSFHGPFIIYNIKDQIVTAPASKSGRANIVIQPDQFKS